MHVAFVDAKTLREGRQGRFPFLNHRYCPRLVFAFVCVFVFIFAFIFAFVKVIIIIVIISMCIIIFIIISIIITFSWYVYSFWNINIK